MTEKMGIDPLFNLGFRSCGFHDLLDAPRGIGQVASASSRKRWLNFDIPDWNLKNSSPQKNVFKIIQGRATQPDDSQAVAIKKEDRDALHRPRSI
jgi:hypothetical protein